MVNVGKFVELIIHLYQFLFLQIQLLTFLIFIIINIFIRFNPLNFFLFFFFIINLIILNLPNLNLIKNNKFSLYYFLIINIIKSDFYKINKSKYSIKFLLIIFLIIIIINLIDLLSFSFCLNSQLNLFFFFRFILWLSIIYLSFFFTFKILLSHFVPQGCPIILSPFIVIIEIISLLIRPITLRVRISANLLAGHLLIHLLVEFSFYLIKIRELNLIISLLFLIILNILEIGVAIIQPYIFCTLLNMYLCENN